MGASRLRLIRREIPRLCRGDGQGLTSSGVMVRRQGKRPLTRPAPAGESTRRGPPSPLGEGCGLLGVPSRTSIIALSLGKWEMPIFSAPVRAMIFSLSEGRGWPRDEVG